LCGVIAPVVVDNIPTIPTIHLCGVIAPVVVDSIPTATKVWVIAPVVVDNIPTTPTIHLCGVIAPASRFARYLGLGLSEYGQTKQDKVDVHVYPSGHEVVKAFTANDFVFKDAHNNIITDISDSTTAKTVTFTWRIQKNWQNNQSVTLAADNDNPSVCPVRASLQLVSRAWRLNQLDDLPVCFNTNNRGKNVYLTGSKIADVLHKVVKIVYPDISKPDLSRYSAHSFRVWACVLLDEKGKSPKYIKKRLHWLGELFRTYLRDTATIQDQHWEALNDV